MLHLPTHLSIVGGPRENTLPLGTQQRFWTGWVQDGIHPHLQQGVLIVLTCAMCTVDTTKQITDISPAEAAAVPGRDGDLHQRARPPPACRRHAAGGHPLARYMLLPHQLGEIEETVRLHHCQTFQRAGNQKFPSSGEDNHLDIKYLKFIF